MKGTSQVRESIIMGFAWSEKHQRIGACLKDFTMSFWDASDMFKFEKQFLISSNPKIKDFQSKLWYIDYLEKWLTTDITTNRLYSWDIEKETIE